MMAGAPGAFGSLVIFSSSGETGWKLTDQTVDKGVIRNKKMANERSFELQRVDMAIFTCGVPIRCRIRQPEEGRGARGSSAVLAKRPSKYSTYGSRQYI
jgi:hypothetical protein